MSEPGQRDIEEDIFQMMQAYGAASRRELCAKLGVSKNMIRKWELTGKIPRQFLPQPKRPVQVIAALAVLRDGQLNDTDARCAARTFLEQLEANHA
jgi:Bacteriophage CI repressor helix-turn-helix domain